MNTLTRRGFFIAATVIAWFGGRHVEGLLERPRCWKCGRYLHPLPGEPRCWEALTKGVR
jgi:hypothetical protein